MQDLSNIMRKSLSKKFLGRQAIGAVAQNIVHKMYPAYAKDMIVYIKFHTLFIKPANHWDKIIFFKEKDKIIMAINTWLEQVWYQQKVTNIIFK